MIVNHPMRRLWIVLHENRGSLPPTLDELAVRLGISKTAVRYRLKRLQRLGIVRVDKGISRGIFLVEPYTWFEG